MSRKIWVPRVSGPLGQYAAGYGLWLKSRAYSPWASADRLYQFDQFSRWLEQQGRAAPDVTEEDAEGFAAARRMAGVVMWSAPRSALMPLQYLRELGVAPEPAPVATEGLLEELLADGRWECAACHSRKSVTAGTIFDRTRTPLTVRFTVCWMFATAKSGTSALALQRDLQIGSYQTAWAMLHRLRSVLVRPGRERLTGTVEVDETYIGGEEPGLSGGRAKGKKVLTGIAVETFTSGALGRCRMAPLTDASAKSLHAFVREHVEPGATVITDGWSGYRGLRELGYAHQPRSQRAARARGEDTDKLLPGVHRIASLAKRWLLSTHQGAATPEHLPSYLNEFIFRFNRRRARNQGLLFYRAIQLAVAHDPVRYKDITATKRPRETMPKSPGVYGTPPSLERRRASRPWRRAAPIYSG